MLSCITSTELTPAQNAELTEVLAKNPILGIWFETLAHNTLIHLAGLEILEAEVSAEQYLRKQAYARGQLELLNTMKNGQEVAVNHINPKS